MEGEKIASFPLTSEDDGSDEIGIQQRSEKRWMAVSGVWMYIYICVDVLHIVMYTSMHISMYIGMYIGMYISMNIYVFIYICVYICKRQDMPPPATGW